MLDPPGLSVPPDGRGMRRLSDVMRRCAHYAFEGSGEPGEDDSPAGEGRGIVGRSCIRVRPLPPLGMARALSLETLAPGGNAAGNSVGRQTYATSSTMFSESSSLRSVGSGRACRRCGLRDPVRSLRQSPFDASLLPARLRALHCHCARVVLAADRGVPGCAMGFPFPRAC